jgi:acetolactate synthase-1/2/3 large subunit
MLRFDQLVMNHPERGVNLFNPDWKKLSDSFGIEFTETDLDNLSKVLKMRANSNAPGIVLIKDEIYPPKSTSPRWNEQ